MADVFVSYKAEDRERAGVIAQALKSEGFDVWWDPALQAGEDYQEVIDNNLRTALVVVVLWSPRSIRSRWVRSEATVGDNYGALAPAMIERCDLPTAFVLVQTADLSAWRGDRKDPKWSEFVDDVRAKRDKRRAQRSTGPKAAAAPKAGEIESLFWQSIKDSNDPGDFQSYLHRYPRGDFASLARNRMASLRGGGRGRGERHEGSSTPLWIGGLVVVAVAAAGWFYFNHMRTIAQAGSPGTVVAAGPSTTTPTTTTLTTTTRTPTRTQAVTSAPANAAPVSDCGQARADWSDVRDSSDLRVLRGYRSEVPADCPLQLAQVDARLAQLEHRSGAAAPAPAGPADASTASPSGASKPAAYPSPAESTPARQPEVVAITTNCGTYYATFQQLRENLWQESDSNPVLHFNFIRQGGGGESIELCDPTRNGGICMLYRPGATWLYSRTGPATYQRWCQIVDVQRR